jgi:hypothetical protein
MQARTQKKTLQTCDKAKDRKLPILKTPPFMHFQAAAHTFRERVGDKLRLPINLSHTPAKHLS